MTGTYLILDETFALSSRYRVILHARRVPADERFPSGVRVRFVLIDVEGNFPRLLVDNHEPYGFHMHTGLPRNKHLRIRLEAADHEVALELFFKEVERIVKNEAF